MPSKTIDNLGYDASQRYALDQQLLGDSEKIHLEAKTIFNQTQIHVSTPSFNSELDLLFNAAQKNPAWAEFHPPSGYSEYRKHFFTYQLLPSLAIQEKNESYVAKIMNKNTEDPNKEKQKENKSRADWESEKESKEEEKEKLILLELLNCILNLDKCMIYVNAKRTQYHKG